MAKTASDLKINEVISFCFPTGPRVTAEVGGVFLGASFTGRWRSEPGKAQGAGKGAP